MVIRRQAAAIIVGQYLSFRDGEKRIMGLEVFRLEKERLIGGHQRQVHLVGKRHGLCFQRTVIASLTLQFDVEPVAEGFPQESKPCLRPVRTVGGKGAADRPQCAAGKHDDIFRQGR